MEPTFEEFCNTSPKESSAESYRYIRETLGLP